MSTLLRIALPTPLRRCFDYSISADYPITQLQAGVRVRVPFGRRELIGILVEVVDKTTIPLKKIKPIIEVLDSEPIFCKEVLALSQWAADYYHYPLGEVFAAALPAKLRQGKPAQLSKKKLLPSPVRIDSEINEANVHSLNTAQQQAVTTIQQAQNTFQVFLLDGVTGSGKTEVYLQAMVDVIHQQQQVLVLVPEIGLTSQTIARFQERFNVPVVALHSGLTEKQRLDAWVLAKQGVAKIIIGTRSAVFTPFEKLGLIIIDEEHDLSFKQQDSFRYHARDVAIMRAQFNQIPIVLGSATPSLESLHNVTKNRFQLLRLPERAGVATLPVFEVVDIRKLTMDQGLSQPLLAAIKECLNQNEQVMLFLNRRGFAPVLMCHACGWMMKCQRCDVSMTYHLSPAKLYCHRCEAQHRVIQACQHCHEKQLYPVGLGTERLEAALANHFPNVSVARIDRDNTTRKGAMDKLLTSIHNGEHPILIGTQMLAKGHHFPNVTLVGIIDVDGGFFSSDFRALERMGQLILQVAGRAGRAAKAGRVFIQTHHPDHPLLHCLLREGYATFANTLLKERQDTRLPPYSFFALFRAQAHQLAHAEQFLAEVKSKSLSLEKNIQIAGPHLAPIPRQAGFHRSQLILQAAQRSTLQKLLKKILPEIEIMPTAKKVRWSLDVDPLELV
jgi:primosomal protein N' (replication factor Y)